MNASSSEANEGHEWSWVDEDDSWTPPPVDLSKPSVARMYDYLLGGKDNFAVDRTAAEHLLRTLPDARDQARANRSFMARSVRFLATTGIRQFIDLGSGLPTSPSVHEIAQAVDSEARVVYVDNDPIVMAHNRAILRDPHVATLSYDMREPEGILTDPRVNSLIDWDQPVAVLGVAVAHFIPVDVASQMMARYRRDLVPGSALALSAVCRDLMPPEAIRNIQEIYAGSSAPFVFRSRTEIGELFGDFELVEPGLVDLSEWHPDGQTPEARTNIMGGVGIKRA